MPTIRLWYIQICIWENKKSKAHGSACGSGRRAHGRFLPGGLSFDDTAPPSAVSDWNKLVGSTFTGFFNMGMFHSLRCHCRAMLIVTQSVTPQPPKLLIPKKVRKLPGSK